MSAPLDRLRQLVSETAIAVRGDGSEEPAGLKVERPKRAGQGDYSTNAAMLLAPALQSASGRP
jgi:arginyl-tRNA synthetase